MIPIAASETLTTVREVLRCTKKRIHNGLLIAGFITMLIALWSVLEPGLHKGREFIREFTVDGQRAMLEEWFRGEEMKN